MPQDVEIALCERVVFHELTLQVCEACDKRGVATCFDRKAGRELVTRALPSIGPLSSEANAGAADVR